MAGQDVGDDERLDGEGIGDAACTKHVDHHLGHAEIGEGLRRHMELLLACGHVDVTAEDSGDSI